MHIVNAHPYSSLDHRSLDRLTLLMFPYPISFQDIDECSMNDSLCHDLAVCHNYNGSFTCDCEEGFEGDGVYNCSGIIRI